MEKARQTTRDRGFYAGDKPFAQTIISYEESVTNDSKRGTKVEQITVVKK